MSKFYGTLSSDAGEDKTKTGHGYMRATAQSWEGSVSVLLFENNDGSMSVIIEAESGSASHPAHTVGHSKLSDLLSGKGLS